MMRTWCAWQLYVCTTHIPTTSTSRSLTTDHSREGSPMEQRKRSPRIYVRPGTPLVATFSIVGHDPQNGDLGIAVASKFLAVGAVVPWARAGVGAIATQSWANTAYGPDGLALLEQGQNPQEVLDQLLAGD